MPFDMGKDVLCGSFFKQLQGLYAPLPGQCRGFLLIERTACMRELPQPGKQSGPRPAAQRRLVFAGACLPYKNKYGQILYAALFLFRPDGKLGDNIAAFALQSVRSGHSAHLGVPFGRQTVAPNSMSAWL